MNFKKINIKTIPSALAILSMITFSTGAVYAQDKEEIPFTLASFEGTYAGQVTAATGGGGVGSVGTVTFDGEGNWTGISVWNVEGQIKQFPVQGTYTVNPDGYFSVFSGGEKPGADGIGIISRFRLVDCTRLALEGSFLISGVGPAGNVLTSYMVRQSDESFQPRSLYPTDITSLAAIRHGKSQVSASANCKNPSK